MDVSIGTRWEGFVEELVKTGRYDTNSDVVLEGLRLVEEREAKLQALRDTLNASIERGGSYTSEQVRDHVRTTLDRWQQAREG